MTSVASVSVLDDAGSNFFEGQEKLNEIWFAPSEDHLKDARGLRKVRRAVWEDMLDLVRCKVLSVIEGEDVDAYLLSESSMFVWPHKIILKTCGTTTLLYGIERLLAIAREECGLKTVWRCFYSRKAFMYPEKQIGPHRNWDEEVRFLDNVFGKGKGSSYVVGKMNGDHWLLYMTTPLDDHEAARDNEDHLAEEMLSTSLSSQSNRLAKPPSPPDQTLEILMTRLSAKAREAFYYPPQEAEAHENGDEDQQGHAAGTQLSKRLGIDTLLDDSTIDSFLFTPCGYSANIVKEDRYATIHVTPEEGWSYASFECNMDFRGQDAEQAGGSSQRQDSMHELVGRVLDIFEPETFSMTLFISVEESASGVDSTTAPETRTILDPKVARGYKRTDRILYEFAGYHLLYSTFEKQ